MRRALPVLSAVALVAALTACTSNGTTAPTPSGSSAAASADICGLKGGSEVDAVKVSTDLATPPTVEFTKGLAATTTQRKVVVTGAGAEVKSGDQATLTYSLYNGATGEKIDEYGFSAPQQALTIEAGGAQTPEVFSNAVGCQPAGSRVLVVAPANDVVGEQGSEQFGLSAGDAVVLVVDSVLNTADGADQSPTAGFPEVSFEKGEPKVAIPSGATPPTTTSTEVLKSGTGDIVGSDDTVYVQYAGVNWQTGKQFDSSFSRGQPAAFSVQGVVPGFRDGLVGQKVGSRVVIVVPPDQGYGPSGGQESAGIGATDTIVFVVDILGTKRAA